jgi:hypothetical protein
MSKIGQSAYSINKSKTYSDQGKDNAIDGSVDEDVHDHLSMGSDQWSMINDQWKLRPMVLIASNDNC